MMQSEKILLILPKCAWNFIFLGNNEIFYYKNVFTNTHCVKNFAFIHFHIKINCGIAFILEFSQIRPVLIPTWLLILL